MATLMSALLIGLAVLLTLGCHNEGENEEPMAESNRESPPQPHEQASVDGLAMTLDVVDGRCRLVYGEADNIHHILLAIPPPCRFVRGDSPEKIGTKKYSSDGYTATVLIVIGGVAKPDLLIPTTRTDCGNRGQGVLISDGKVVPALRVATGGACAGMGLDEKAYRIIYDDEKHRLPF